MSNESSRNSVLMCAMHLATHACVSQLACVRVRVCFLTMRGGSAAMRRSMRMRHAARSRVCGLLRGARCALTSHVTVRGDERFAQHGRTADDNVDQIFGHRAVKRSSRGSGGEKRECGSERRGIESARLRVVV